jgi:pimeloyl-ACP methyl ester carboxylesterase
MEAAPDKALPFNGGHEVTKVAEVAPEHLYRETIAGGHDTAPWEGRDGRIPQTVSHRGRGSPSDANVAPANSREGEPADVVEVIRKYGQWLAQSQIPKLYFHAEPGEVDIGKRRSFVRQWPNQKEIEVKGGHFVQEDSPTEIGAAISEFVRDLRRTK